MNSPDLSLDLNIDSEITSPNPTVIKKSSSIAEQTIVCLGEDVVKNIQELEEYNYCFLQAKTAKDLYITLRAWNKTKYGRPIAVIIDDKSLPNLLLENIMSIRHKGVFKGVPFFAFAKKRDRVALSAINSLKIDDYEPYPINLKSLSAKINVFKSLKKAGISTWGIVSESDFSSNEKASSWSNKRFFDILVAATFLLLVSPLLLLIVIAIKLESKGPVFYTSKRAGKDYRIFDFYKFRSMHKDADAKLAALKESQNQYKDGNQFVKIKNDPRITRVGNFLRNTSLDEIPQLYNVLKGDMSIVGNRPLPLYEAELLTVDDHAERFLGPAGITGLWQVLKRGKGEVSSEERILLDRVYARKSSMLFDVKIILMTIPALFQSETV